MIATLNIIYHFAIPTMVFNVDNASHHQFVKHLSPIYFVIIHAHEHIINIFINVKWVESS